MAKFTYNNVKNASTSYMLLELNCEYNLGVLFKYETNPYSRSYSTNKLAKELRELRKI